MNLWFLTEYNFEDVQHKIYKIKHYKEIGNGFFPNTLVCNASEWKNFHTTSFLQARW